MIMYFINLMYRIFKNGLNIKLLLKLQLKEILYALLSKKCVYIAQMNTTSTIILDIIMFRKPVTKVQTWIYFFHVIGY